MGSDTNRDMCAATFTPTSMAMMSFGFVNNLNLGRLKMACEAIFDAFSSGHVKFLTYVNSYHR
jgi:hypothetical protein